MCAGYHESPSAKLPEQLNALLLCVQFAPRMWNFDDYVSKIVHIDQVGAPSYRDGHILLQQKIDLVLVTGVGVAHDPIGKPLGCDYAAGCCQIACLRGVN
jgi:hypothetical protein